MTVDTPAPQPYASPAPAYAPPEAYYPPAPTYVDQMGYPQQYGTTVYRTTRNAGGGLSFMGILVWIFSFLFLNNYSIFWTLQTISYCFCFFGFLISLVARRRATTYVVTAVSVLLLQYSSIFIY